jgi:hypothetical protein
MRRLEGSFNAPGVSKWARSWRAAPSIRTDLIFDRDRTFVGRLRPWLVIETTLGPFNQSVHQMTGAGGKCPLISWLLMSTRAFAKPSDRCKKYFARKFSEPRDERPLLGVNRTSRRLVRMSANDPKRALFAFKRKADVDSVTSVSEAFVNHIDRAAFQGPRFWP